jgi:hypothetical protein
MKKLLLVLVAVMGLTFAANAQYNGKAIGVRLGGGYYNGGELSYQMPMGSNRAELNLGWANSDFASATGVYQWLGNIKGEWGWFAGPGVNLGYCINHGFGVAAVLEGGIEWNPEALPLQFTLDIRPSWDFLKREGCAYNGFAVGGALGIRYKL